MRLCSDSFTEFIHTLLANPKTPEVVADAFRRPAGELRLGKVYVHLQVPPTRVTPKGEDKELVLYDAGLPLEEEAGYSVDHPTGRTGHAVITAWLRKGENSWTLEEREDLHALLDVTLLHMARYRMIGIIEDSAFIQYLSGLPNGGGFLKFAEKVFGEGKLGTYDSYYFNLRGTSIMNIRYGAQESDRVIKRYADELSRCVAEDECLGHLGGDNFVALIKKEHAAAFRERLHDVEVWAERGPRREVISVSANVGIMELDSQMDGYWMVISGPNIALQTAKRTGQSQVILTQEMMEQSNRSRIVESSFHNALIAGEFQPYFQPKVDMKDGKIIGAEVLTRWIQNGSLVSPAEFIPVLERTGYIADLDLYMLDQACMFISQRRSEGKEIVPLSVNISRRDLEVPELARRIHDSFQRYGVEKQDIIIEVTETTNQKESGMMMRFLSELRAAGIDASIDDFGTGFSSLSFLRDFPVSEIKIDRSFINHNFLENKDRVIIGSIIRMANELGVHVITEGVETWDQVNFLLDQGCDCAQGFLYDRPLPREEYEERLEKKVYTFA